MSDEVLERLVQEVVALRARVAALETKETPGKFTELLASGDARVGGGLYVGSTAVDPPAGQIVQGSGGNCIRAVFTVPLTDAKATRVFRVLTTYQGASGNGGTWAAHINALVINGAASGTEVVAAKAYQGSVVRAMNSAGSGVAVASEWHESASAATNAGYRDIGAVSLGAAEVSEFDIHVYLNADGTGTGAVDLRALVSVELLWYGFSTPPQLG